MPITRPDGVGRFHPIHALFLAFPIALFTAGLVTDVAYLKTAEIQWTNFSAWLIVGGLAFGTVVLIWAAIDLALVRGGRTLIYFALLAAMQLIGLWNAFQHSRDGWSSVGGTGLILSLVTSLLALAAGYLAHSRAAPAPEIVA